MRYLKQIGIVCTVLISLELLITSVYSKTSGYAIGSTTDIEIDDVGRVYRVIDGDTFDCFPCGRIRLADVDAPEVGEPGYYEAKNALTSLVLGKKVYLDVDCVGTMDRYNRLICVVYVRHNRTHLLNVNKWLLDHGYVELKDYDNEFDPLTWSLYVYCPSTDGFPQPFTSGGIANVTFVVGETKSHGLYNLGARTVDVAGAIGVSYTIGLSSNLGICDHVVDIDVTNVINGDIVINWSKIRTLTVIAIGGPLVNMFTCYYSPVNQSGYGGCPFYLYWEVGVKAAIRSELTGKEYSKLGKQEDYAIIAIHYDEHVNKWIIVAWGLTGYGTQAACLVLKNQADYGYVLEYRAVIIKWTDANGNGVVDENDKIDVIETWSG